MAKDFFDAFAVSRDVFTEASDTLGLDLRAICFGGDERLDRTEFTQPAILVAEMAMLRAMQAQLGFSPTAFGGHSLGEYTALCAAGALPLASAVRVVRARGALMQAAVPVGEGAMIAVIGAGVGERDLLAGLGEDDVDVANRNSKDQVVLSGGSGAIARVSRVLVETGLEVVPLNVSAPFHSRRMRAIEPAFRELLDELAPLLARDRATAVTSNLRGGFHRPDDLLDALTEQISGTVDWVANMRALQGVADKIYEVGPNRPLRGFFKSVGRDITSIVSVKVAQRELSL